MVVALLHAACAVCAELRAHLGTRSATLRAREAAEVALDMDGPGEGPMLAREVARALGLDPGLAVVIVADRFGEAFAALSVHGVNADALLDEAEAWIEHIQQQCPE
jgi:hypothetical protein